MAGEMQLTTDTLNQKAIDKSTTSPAPTQAAHRASLPYSHLRRHSALDDYHAYKQEYLEVLRVQDMLRGRIK